MNELENTYALPGVADTVSELNKLGPIIANCVYFLILAALVVYLVQIVAKKFLYPRLENKRFAIVLIGALHAIVLVVAVLLVLGRIGFDISVFGPVALMVVMIGAVIIFFLAPFLPTLPFKIGNMVEIGGVMGTVETITPIFTHLRTFDGEMVFIPNAMVWAKNITNYHHTTTRRVVLKLNVSSNDRLADARNTLTKIMSSDERVLNDPAPVVYIMAARADGVEMTGFCWVNNGNWFSTRSDLYEKVVTAAQSDSGISLSLDKQEVILSGEVGGR
jgi:small conductance mechanosensitive channel